MKLLDEGCQEGEGVDVVEGVRSGELDELAPTSSPAGGVVNIGIKELSELEVDDVVLVVEELDVWLSINAFNAVVEFHWSVWIHGLARS